MLVLLADLPLVTSEDVELLFRQIQGDPEVMLVPGKEGDGTNAVLRVPLAAGPTTVREIFLAAAQDWGFALWSAGAALPLWPCAAWLRTVSVCSMAAAQQSASMASALHNCASGAQWSKCIPDSIGLVRECWWRGTGRQAARGTQSRTGVNATATCSSLAAYQEKARCQSIACRVVEIPRVAFDLDPIADLERFATQPTQTHTYKVLQECDICFRVPGE